MNIFFLVLSFLLGCLNVINRTINFQATKYLGTNSGCLMNYIVASIASFCILVVYPEARFTIQDFSSAPVYLYLGGVFGVIAFFLNITSLQKLNLFQSGIMILIGQLIASFLLDFMFGYTFSITKIIGILILTVGVIYDKKVSLN